LRTPRHRPQREVGESVAHRMPDGERKTDGKPKKGRLMRIDKRRTSDSGERRAVPDTDPVYSSNRRPPHDGRGDREGHQPAPDLAITVTVQTALRRRSRRSPSPKRVRRRVRGGGRRRRALCHRVRDPGLPASATPRRAGSTTYARVSGSVGIRPYQSGCHGGSLQRVARSTWRVAKAPGGLIHVGIR